MIMIYDDGNDMIVLSLLLISLGDIVSRGNQRKQLGTASH